MKTYKLFIVGVLTAWLFSCCQEATKSEFWGETSFYSDFPLKKYKPVIMERTLNFEFNEDAKRLITGDIEFEIGEKNEHNQLVCVEGIVLYRNGEKCAGNILKVTASEDTVRLGIEFTENAREGNHTLYLQATKTGGLDRIDYLELTDGFYVRKQIVWNPLGKFLFWLGVVIIGFLACWRLILRPLWFETFTIKTVSITYSTVRINLKIKGSVKVVCTNKPHRQSFINRFFMGKIVFEQNDFWVQDMEIVPKNKKSVRIRIPYDFIISPDSTVIVGTNTEITNTKTKDVVKLKIN